MGSLFLRAVQWRRSGSESGSDGAQVGDVVNFQLGVKLSALLQDGAHLVAGDGVHAAAKGHQLDEPCPAGCRHVRAALYIRAW